MVRKNPNPINNGCTPQPETPLTARQRLLREAERITATDRNTNYGNAEDNFQHIADFWMTYLGVNGRNIEITPCDVANMMILMKTARLGKNPMHFDSLLDIAGYAACGHECQVAAVGAVSI